MISQDRRLRRKRSLSYMKKRNRFPYLPLLPLTVLVRDYRRKVSHERRNYISVILRGYHE